MSIRRQSRPVTSPEHLDAYLDQNGGSVRGSHAQANNGPDWGYEDIIQKGNFTKGEDGGYQITEVGGRQRIHNITAESIGTHGLHGAVMTRREIAAPEASVPMVPQV